MHPLIIFQKMLLHRPRPREMYFTKTSLGNYRVTLITNRAVPITPGYIIFCLSRKMTKRTRLKGVISCLHDKNAFLNCLRLRDFYLWKKKLQLLNREKCWRYQEVWQDRDGNDKRWTDIWIRQTSGKTQIVKKESSHDEVDCMFLFFCSFNLCLFHVFQQNPAKISHH